MGSVAVVDFGGQYTHLIARRVREVGVFSSVIPASGVTRDALEGFSAVILSGGPGSVLDDDAGRWAWLLDLGVPVLGICFGHQLLARLAGGEVVRGPGEFGRARVRVVSPDTIMAGWGPVEEVWMSHYDHVAEVPGAEVLALTEHGTVAAFRLRGREVYGVQFHPEVRHTPRGAELIRNFLFKVAQLRPTWRPASSIEERIREIRSLVGEGEKVLVAVSGGIDSAVTARLVKEAVGDRLLAVLVDHGLFREGEVPEIVALLREAGIRPLVIDAAERFISRLEGVSNCELRRRIVGETFAEIFREMVESDPSIKWLAQGTTYPDVIESGASPGAARIKSHHNVAGLPEWLGMGLIEPLRDLYKDEVREIARTLGMPEALIKRHPFPGPGLAVRIVGEFTREKLRVARVAGRVVEDVLREAGIYERVWQAFAVVGDDEWVGVKGDRGERGYVVIVRVVESEDGMTADWVRLPHDVMDEIARRVTQALPEVTMVAYAITPKPPATIEPC